MPIDWKSFVIEFARAGVAVAEQKRLEALHQRFAALLYLENSAAQAQISSIVERSSGREIREYEEFFLWNISIFGDPWEKQRAAELFGWFKVKCWDRFGTFTFSEELRRIGEG